MKIVMHYRLIWDVYDAYLLTPSLLPLKTNNITNNMVSLQVTPVSRLHEVHKSSAINNIVFIININSLLL